MTNPYLVKIWADAIGVVMADIFLFALVVGVFALIAYIIKHPD